jgi:hypothetical protein
MNNSLFKTENMETITLNEFEERLKNHDWRYNYSDDFSKWIRGDQEYKRLIRFASQSKEHEELFNKYKNEQFDNNYTGQNNKGNS